MKNITVLLFANLKDQAGTNRILLQMPDDLTVADVKVKVGQLYPALQPYLATTITAVNQE
ncbi:MAG: MoaD/ThiS family protein, partial [Chloroflexi bacterium]|nr:MoaD/ThiS family protein [Chloroflexota bacterium]